MDLLTMLRNDMLIGFGNEPPQMSKRAKVRPKSIVFRHKDPQQTKPWKQIHGDPDHCIICGTTKEVSRQKYQLNMAMCKSCRSKFVKGEITPEQFVSKLKEITPQPMNTSRTVGRVRAIKGSLVKELGNARWIRCSCGRRFKTVPFKPYHTHPPAFEKFIAHCRHDAEGHMPIDWSDRDPAGESAVMARLHPLTGWPTK